MAQENNSFQGIARPDINPPIEAANEVYYYGLTQNDGIQETGRAPGAGERLFVEGRGWRSVRIATNETAAPGLPALRTLPRAKAAQEPAS